MPDYCSMRTSGNAIHTPPASAHIQKWAVIPVETTKCVPAAHLARQAHITYLAKVIIHFKHKSSCTFNHNRTNNKCRQLYPFHGGKMVTTLKVIGIIILLILLLLLVIPLLIPIPPLENISPVEELADSDSKFVQIDDINFHYKTSGQDGTPLVLLHGFGASIYSWREVMPTLAENHAVFAYDRPAFGLTERPVIWTDENPYTLNASISQLHKLLDNWDITNAILVGNSAGGRVAMEYTLAHPERVQALILVSPAVGNHQSATSKYRQLINLPQVQRLGPLMVRKISESGLETLSQAWHDPSKQPADTIPLYTKPLQVENWDIGLWHYSTTANQSDLPNQLDQFDLPILLITGDDDRLVATEKTVALKDQLPKADLVVIPNCGHVPQEECPDAFLNAVGDFLSELEN
jgi:pimeloyl-ACP methyl ester carboxylesterase